MLLIDIGNTRIKWGYAASGNIVPGGEVVHRDVDTDTALAFLAEITEVPQRVCAVNVGGHELEAALAKETQQLFGIRPEFYRTAAECGRVRCGYAEPGQLGVDRWAAIVAAWFRYRRAICVVDAGTAVTIDGVDAAGQHLGGIILPGLDLMREALYQDTSDILDSARRNGAERHEADWYGANTRAAVEKGAPYMLGSAVDRAAAELAGDHEPAAVLTGGDAADLRSHLSVSVELRPNLVLEGLLRMVEAGDDA